MKITDQMLQAIFTKPVSGTKRPFFKRLLASIRLVVRGNRRGPTYVGVRGGAEF